MLDGTFLCFSQKDKMEVDPSFLFIYSFSATFLFLQTTSRDNQLEP